MFFLVLASSLAARRSTLSECHLPYTDDDIFIASIALPSVPVTFLGTL